MWLARSHLLTIISADSRQIYRGFDVGTAKPTRGEQKAVPHRGIDVVAPTDRYSAAAWANAADVWIADARAAGRTPLVVGGSGFYLQALFGSLFEEPLIDSERRARVELFLGRMSGSELVRWAAALDPARAHLGRAQLVRAVEIALLTGSRVSVLHRERARPPRHTARYLVVDPGPELPARIETRIDAMLDGWTREVRELIAEVPPDAPAWNATGYRTVRGLVSGVERPGTNGWVTSREDAVRTIVTRTRQYAKRQRTWFRHQLPAERVTRVDPSATDWMGRVERWWNAAGRGARTP
jgi:tRNA dimethylallyltransferase